VCRAVALLLFLAVVSPWAAAAAPRDRAVRPHPVRFEITTPLASLWNWLAGFWEKNGCMIYPSGSCLPGTEAAPVQPASSDNGCGLDPWGRCLG